MKSNNLSKKWSVLVVLMLTIYNFSFAQNENTVLEDSILQADDSEKFVWDMSLGFKTMNVFRGLLPSKAPTISTQAGFKYGDFILGFYGGSSFNGGYTETDLILVYYKPKVNVHLEWYYNFTEGITNIPTPSGFFDFNPETTRGLLDLILNYQISPHVKLSSSTFLFGRDRPSLPEDDAEGILLRRGEQRYTQYLKAAYNWYWGTSKLEAHVAGSFSWNDFSGPTFYGNKPGFNDIGISISRKLINSNSLSIPVKASAYINTVTNNIYLVATIQLIEISKLTQ
ncbi:hypothetical protein DFQ04_1107 [Algoriphagus boseongensis]|uniref:Outer membrane beta-barrel porin/alpha-amylase n=1 Tax=Algoriphagus boseongensis TaxID=1442587 RepID=A0A4R6T959_9BACT|nr:hypothetical protein [Algoriphagus boseongensis]TDQ19286.1 hypothetical protein DFQ04_1107 [Algoriphagus boseongensis]